MYYYAFSYYYRSQNQGLKTSQLPPFHSFHLHNELKCGTWRTTLTTTAMEIAARPTSQPYHYELKRRKNCNFVGIPQITVFSLLQLIVIQSAGGDLQGCRCRDFVLGHNSNYWIHEAGRMLTQPPTTTTVSDFSRYLVI